MGNKREPNVVEVLPCGAEVQFYDEIGVDGKPQARRYLIDGERFANVTTILNVLQKEALLGWVERLTREGRNWREVRDEASERGHGTHHLLLQVLTGQGASLADLSAEWRPWGQAGFKWVRARRPKIIRNEAMVASLAHKYAGRLDLLAGVDGVRTLTEFKTLTKWSYERDAKTKELTDRKYPPYDENLLQLDLYQGGLIESGYDPAERGLIVRLGPDAEYDETFVDLDPQRGIDVLAAFRAKAEVRKALKKASAAMRVSAEMDEQIAEAVAQMEVAG
jgi:hypothetical protein